MLAGTSYATAEARRVACNLSGRHRGSFTGLSFAELVTVIPKATGGGYVYVKEATETTLSAFICGWGFWLGYAMSCGLFALGFEILSTIFFRLFHRWQRHICLWCMSCSRILRNKSSGTLQNVITTMLVALLALYVVVGIFHLDMDNRRPIRRRNAGCLLMRWDFSYDVYRLWTDHDSQRGGH